MSIPSLQLPSPPLACLFSSSLSPCSNVHLFFNIKKNCFLRLIVLFLFSLSLFWKHLQCLMALESSTQTSRNGTWPRSLTCKKVRVNLPLFNSPLHHLLFFFFLSLSLWSNVHLFFNIKKNCFSRFYFSFYDLALLSFGNLCSVF